MFRKIYMHYNERNGNHLPHRGGTFLYRPNYLHGLYILSRRKNTAYNETPTKGFVMKKPALAQAAIIATAIFALKVTVALAINGTFS